MQEEREHVTCDMALVAARDVMGDDRRGLSRPAAGAGIGCVRVGAPWAGNGGRPHGASPEIGGDARVTCTSHAAAHVWALARAH